MAATLAAMDYVIRIGATPAPSDVRRGVFVRAALEGGAVPAWLAHCACEQTFRPDYDDLIRAGLAATRQAQGRFAIAMCRLIGDRDHDLANVARSHSLLEAGGILLVAGPKTAGAASIEAKVGKHLALEGAESKYHCRVFWVRRSEDAPPAALAEWQAAGAIQRMPDSGMFAAPGMFGHDKVDIGSCLLAEHFDARLAGRVADLGSGWGYLSFELLRRSPAIRQLDLYEAEYLAIEATSMTLRDRPECSSEVHLHWIDVTAGLPTGGYDWIVTNPPFHHGRRTDPEIGRAFIRSAAASLGPDGRLLMVANNHLPYEAALTSAFQGWRELERAAGFKVIEAWSPLAAASDARRKREKAPSVRRKR